MATNVQTAAQPAHMPIRHVSSRNPAAQQSQLQSQSRHNAYVLPSQRVGHQSHPFDAETLVRKLEDHRLSLLVHERRSVGYVPRNAAQQFVNTTATLKDKQERLKKSLAAETNSALLKRAASNPHRSKPNDLNNANLAINEMSPKQLQAALSLRMKSGNRPGVRRESTGSIPSKPYKDDAARHRELPISDHPARSYKPGDAAKRNEKRRSDQHSVTNKPSGLLNEFHFPSEADQYEYRVQRYITDETPCHDQTLSDLSEETGRKTPPRPKLTANDRHNWAQQSQCGEDMRHILHFPRITSKNKDNAKDKSSPDSKHSLTAAAVSAPLPVSTSADITARRRHTYEKHTADHVPPASLVSDAVQKIKTEERMNRRKSIIGFFKRFN
ncbi:Hypothetical protein R9X50_00792700 [Acrodontium crateriforme]|uniref:Uncharacterized protein n=1 Tax=Acrodontium crateriforme TaxID=150365 RepID=A0AAQ3MAZ9_9PEZI|nr:Hypothetical protein R9X50_00792700 [Acrodontium crateriforme]